MTAPAAPDRIVFVDAHVPAMEAGVYEVTVRQQVTRLQPAPLEQRARIHVRGPRWTLLPSWIESRYPPPSVEAPAAGALPHVVLTRSTLPWERRAVRGGTDGDHPWLAVLLLTEREIAGGGGLPAVREDQVAVGSLGAGFPDLPAERGSADEQVRVVDIPIGLLGLLPEASWLRTLTHVRERFLCGAPAAVGDDLDRDDLASLRSVLSGHGHHLGPDAAVRVEVPGAEWRVDGDRPLWIERAESGELAVTDEARAVVLGCRVTVPGGRYRAYLVSLEGRYVPGTPDPVFDAAGAPTDLVRLVVLDRWEFTVAETAGKLTRLLAGLAAPTTGLTVPTEGRSGAGVDLLRAGYALLPHRLRNGGTVRSLYRGPLLARPENPPLPPGPHGSADALLLADRPTGILITSYAAAWELGRSLTVADPAIGLALARWRADRFRFDHRQRSADDHPHLDGPAGEAPGFPAAVVSWLRRLLVLDGVPFGYLVPDPAMLARESMAVFRLDGAWLAALVEGALGAGDVQLTAPEEQTGVTLPPDALSAVLTHLIPGGAGPISVSGCLIRSEVVAGWPELDVEGWTGATRHQVLRRARLSDNVLLVLFLGDVARIAVHPNPEALHHGVQLGDEPGPRSWRMVPHRIESFPELADVAQGELREREVLDVAAARARPGGGVFTPDTFALRMLAGVPRLLVEVRPGPP